MFDLDPNATNSEETQPLDFTPSPTGPTPPGSTPEPDP